MDEAFAIRDAAAQFLPHRHPAHLVTEIHESSEESLSCTGMFPQDHPMVVDGRLPTFLGIEPAAQAAATHIAILATESGREIDELDGVLAGARNVRIHRPWLPAGTELQIRVMPRSQARGLHRFAFELRVDSQLACEGELSTFVRNDLR